MEGRRRQAAVGCILTLLVLIGFSGWVRADSGWSFVPTRQAPPWRSHAAMTYDAMAARVILFGGNGYGTDFYNDTWAFDPATNLWSNKSRLVAPPLGFLSGMVYDSRAARDVAFVNARLGSNHTELASETWSYDYTNNTWTNRTPRQSPPEGSVFGMAYDAQVGRVIAIADGTLWAYDYAANTWSRIDPPLGPSGFFCHSLAYDSAFGRVIAYGGLPYRATWGYVGANDSWENLTPAVQPPVFDGAMLYDEAARQTVLFGGELPPLGWPFVTNETWAFDFAKAKWTLLNLTERPPAGFNQAGAYVPSPARILLFGGTAGPGSAGMWSLAYPSLPSASPAPLSIWYFALPVIFGGAVIVAWLTVRRRERRRKGWERK